MDINIKTKKWHYHLYILGVKMWCRFTGDSEWKFTEYANLCTYVRVIALYLPIMIALQLIVLLSPIWIYYLVSSVYPSFTVSKAIIAFLITGAKWLAVAFAIFLIFFLVFFIVGKLIPGLFEKIKDYKISKKISNAKKDELTAWQIASQWLKDKHDNICRQVKFMEAHNDEIQGN